MARDCRSPWEHTGKASDPSQPREYRDRPQQKPFANQDYERNPLQPKTYDPHADMINHTNVSLLPSMSKKEI